MTKEQTSICPHCKATLSYIPDVVAPYCEMCGVKIYRKT